MKKINFTSDEYKKEFKKYIGNNVFFNDFLKKLIYDDEITINSFNRIFGDNYITISSNNKLIYLKCSLNVIQVTYEDNLNYSEIYRGNDEGYYSLSEKVYSRDDKIKRKVILKSTSLNSNQKCLSLETDNYIYDIRICDYNYHFNETLFIGSLLSYNGSFDSLKALFKYLSSILNIGEIYLSIKSNYDDSLIINNGYMSKYEENYHINDTDYHLHLQNHEFYLEKKIIEKVDDVDNEIKKYVKKG